MKLSIIIPTYGRPKVLKSCLKSIEKIKKEIPRPYEVIVVNNNPIKIRKETSEVCKKIKLPIKEIKTKPLGSVEARNRGIQIAKGEIVFLFDDDTEIQKGYFKHILKHYKDKEVGAVGGAEIKKGNTIFHKLFFSFRKTGNISWSGEITSNFSPTIKEAVEVKHLHGSNFSIRKDVIKKIGLMDKRLEGHYRDETEYLYRVYEEGYKLIFEPKAKVIHNTDVEGGNVSPKQKKKWAYWYHRNTSYFFFKHIYTGNPLQLLAYLIRESIMAMLRAFIYKNPHYLTELKAIKEGYRLAKR